MTPSSRKVVVITLVVMICFAIINWMRGDSHAPDIRTVVPFLDGRSISIYSFGGLALVLLGLLGFSRRRTDASGEDRAENEPEESGNQDMDEPDARNRRSDTEEP